MRNIFIGKSYRKCAPDPSLILVNNPKQPLHARNSFKSKIFWKKTCFISYMLSEQVWCYKSGFLSYYKNYICKYMQENSWHHKLFHCHFSFWIWKVWKGTEKIQKFEYLEDERSFLDEIKNICHSCWRAIIRWKNKNLIKNNGRKL